MVQSKSNWYIKTTSKYPVISGLLISIFLLYLAAHAVQSNWVYFTEYKFNWTITQVGLSLAVVGVLSAVIQGGLIRIIIPKLGQQRSLYVGLALYCLGFVLFAFASQSWMMYAFLVPYCLGGISGPALQGIISTHVPPNEQGELQGGMTSLMSLAAIFGPILMSQLFYGFTREGASFNFAGAPMLMGALLALVSALLARASMKKTIG